MIQVKDRGEYLKPFFTSFLPILQVKMPVPPQPTSLPRDTRIGKVSRRDAEQFSIRSLRLCVRREEFRLKGLSL